MEGIKIELPTKALEKTIQEAIRGVIFDWLEHKEKPPSVKPYLTYQETADLLGVTVDTVKKWIKQEGLKVIDLGHKLKRIDYRDLQKFLDLRKVLEYRN